MIMRSNLKLAVALLLLVGAVEVSAKSVKKDLVGKEAPTFKVKDIDGNEFNLSEVLKSGKKVALCFFPTNNMRGSLNRARLVRDNIGSLTDNNIAFLWLSFNSDKNLTKVKNTYALNFPMASDKKQAVAKLFAATRILGLPWAQNVTVLIGENGKVVKVLKRQDIEKNDYVQQIIDGYKVS